MSTSMQRGARPTGRSAVVGGPLTDPATVEPFLAEVAGKVEQFRANALAVVVETDAQVEEAGKVAGEAARYVESLERQRKEFVDPLNAHVRTINSRFKAVTEPLDAAVRIVKDKIGRYWEAKRIAAEAEARRQQKVLDDQRRAQEEAARVELERQRKAAEKAAEEGRVYQARKPVPVVPTAPVPQVVAAPQQKTFGGTTQVRMRWTFEVVELSAVPVEYVEVVGAKVRRAIADGKREIPGLRIFQTPDVAV